MLPRPKNFPRREHLLHLVRRRKRRRAEEIGEHLTKSVFDVALANHLQAALVFFQFVAGHDLASIHLLAHGRSIACLLFVRLSL